MQTASRPHARRGLGPTPQRRRSSPAQARAACGDLEPAEAPARQPEPFGGGEPYGHVARHSVPHVMRRACAQPLAGRAPARRHAPPRAQGGRAGEVHEAPARRAKRRVGEVEQPPVVPRGAEAKARHRLAISHSQGAECPPPRRADPTAEPLAAGAARCELARGGARLGALAVQRGVGAQAHQRTRRRATPEVAARRRPSPKPG